MDIINGMIHDAECSPKTTIVKEGRTERMMTKPRIDENSEEHVEAMMIAPPSQPEVIVIKDNTDMVKKLKTMKTKIEKNFIKQ